MENTAIKENYTGEIEELVCKMLSQSDNTATNNLISKLGNGDASAGMAKINQFCKEHTFTQTSIGRLMLDFDAKQDNYTSTEDCVTFLKAVYEGKLAGSDSILSYLKEQERTGKLPAGVPAGVVTANKTGELEDVENDAAIVYSEKGTYAIAVMMSDLDNTADARETIKTISSQVYTYMVGG
jgi:beta-lactamase class A